MVLLAFSIRSNYYSNAKRHLLFLSHRSCRTRWFGSGPESTRIEFPVQNAYELLGVPENSSFAEIKASFRRLAKETHPDLSDSKNDSTASQRFVQILAAYEILSDSQKRSHYDQYLLSQRKFMQQHSRECSTSYTYKSYMTVSKEMEVVEWLKWYRFAINDILSEKKVVVGTGYFDVLEHDFYAAMHTAYFGPVIESMDLLPDRFEAEERSMYETPEVLHLVSGRDLFGMVCLVNDIPELASIHSEKLTSSKSRGLYISQLIEDTRTGRKPKIVDDVKISNTEAENTAFYKSDTYRDLELHVLGKVVATATRVPPKSSFHEVDNKDGQDHIHVYLCSDSLGGVKWSNGKSCMSNSVGSRIRLGTITGLGTSPDEGSCFVYDSSGTKTHVIMKHRTLLVKHMHWYGVGDEVSVCECRCSRARLPPSKFWLFEPRCGMHDIGGWYVETFGRDKKGRTVAAQRYWNGFGSSEQFETRLHPAVYLLALAYRTLDLEDAKRKKLTVTDAVDRKLFKLLRWCKKVF
ncbi:hypothetical protein HS088_TW13G01141 [Tripterygium wilfordii]|uniref:J domain-containing protein n=1 Tax=Tripterygium wilfordii TaxID=458696 RepID=A0A7J7CVT2_TRIWF|nr:uncharacterized protein LOC120012489 [Tripterygium wilfordii]XP_038719841.1 uncharacterized protein LOC120012489 [Tripterygium wilfordii]XP_038719842.1 uncharacterized protein LOC120012489 [Tripterygium wilfordii]XP_038719843.1 uncharacterized protein LOC120012489 [Tripterygium wilfordii]XP_038719844.1 uncharacterized protein LOC120012489 [Tripterygium wilfordii]XP_038719845.1 uncharacterized protein LOC120012489 [Tripterygium wilfordii]XP_038719847.1 uncharacterized protein LOC120012489 [